MEYTLPDLYEVEKIITSKYYKNKKYYLIKWLCYPISESTWEPKSSLNHLNSLLDKFESEYPFSIDKEMYEIYCKETKKRSKRRNKGKNSKEFKINKKFLSKNNLNEIKEEENSKNSNNQKLENKKDSDKKKENSNTFLNLNLKMNIMTNLKTICI